MRILVTGGCGYIGSTTARLLAKSDHDVVVIDDFSEGHRGAWDGEIHQMDLRDLGKVSTFAESNAIDGIVHFAARAYVGESMVQPLRYWRANLAPVMNLCDAFAGVPFVFSSTCATYGEPDVARLDESLDLNPVNPYGATKAAAERLLSDRADADQGAYLALRYFNAAGADAFAAGQHGEHHDPENHLIPRAILNGLGLLQEELQVFGTDWSTADGTCIRDYIHVSDLAEAHVLALDHLFDGKPSTVLNLGTGRGYSVLEILGAVEAATEQKLNWKAAPRRAGDPAELVADATRAFEVLGWQAEHSSLQNIVETAVTWHRQNPQGYTS
ncbi:MAG: UDP-glucose 4-epimerase GalE [Planctomycetes bacterium]|nr:UDP-glucose 4-epimerase GalE [Planctomycetota bacterium]MCP4772272.1 UDP-glucose 4-epimerase GalE [Planctomycetota bacterium]MCP4861328.1 UDP-glucose 4-epimerase GalE [Planctomycetota bacterium]